MKSLIIVITGLSLFCIIGCKNTPKQVVCEPTTVQTEKEVEKETEKPEIGLPTEAPKQEVVPIIKKEETIAPPPVIEKEVSAPIEKKVETTVKVEPEKVEDEVSPEVDSRLKFKLEEITKDQMDEKMSGLFSAIEEKIIEGDFEGWYNSLSIAYRNFIENPDGLLKMSKQSSYLKVRKIVLRSAKDYFHYIVVPSRQGIALKYVNFQQIDEKNLKVNCMLDDSTNFVYDFTYENESWKLDKK